MRWARLVLWASFQKAEWMIYNGNERCPLKVNPILPEPNWKPDLMIMLTVCSVTQLCSTLCYPMNCSPPGSSVHSFQATVLEWVAISFSSMCVKGVSEKINKSKTLIFKMKSRTFPWYDFFCSTSKLEWSSRVISTTHLPPGPWNSKSMNVSFPLKIFSKDRWDYLTP